MVSPRSMASVRSHGGTPPASPRNGSTSTTFNVRESPYADASVSRMPCTRPASFAQPRGQQVQRGLIELQPGGSHLVFEPAAALTGTRRRRGVGDQATRLLDRIGECLRQPSASGDQDQLGAGQRIAEIGHQAAQLRRR